MHDHDLQDQPVQHRPLFRRIPLGVVAGLSVILVTGSATAWWTWNAYKERSPITSSPSLSDPAVEPAPITTKPGTSPAEDPGSNPIAAEQSVQLYWLKDTGTNLELVPSTISVAQGNDTAMLKTVFDQLLQGPEATDVASTIPPETALLDLTVEADGVHVDLSKEFTSGGGSASMTGRLGQVIYTATALDPTAKVWLSVEGEPLDVLGGEGLLIPQPITRAEFNESFSL